MSNTLRRYRRNLQPRRIKVALTMKKLLAEVGGSQKLLKENFEAVCHKVLVQKTVEVFAPAGSSTTPS